MIVTVCNCVRFSCGVAFVSVCVRVRVCVRLYLCVFV